MAEIIINLDDWRAQQDAHKPEETDFEVGGGVSVRVRRVSVDDLALEGQIPMPLLHSVQQHFQASNGAAPSITTMSADQMRDIDKMARAVVKAAAIAPLVGDKDTKTHISIERIRPSVRIQILTWCASEVRAYEGFSEQQRTGTLGVAHGAGVPRAAVGDAAHQE